MTNLLLFNILEDEQTVADVWEKRNPTVTLDSNGVELTPNTVDQARGYDGILLQQDNPIAPEVYPRLKELGIKQIGLRTTGYDIIDFDLAKQNGITITNVPAYSPRSVSELVLAHTMWLLRHLNTCEQRAERGDFRWEGMQAREIHQLTVGIIGAGKIGSEVARVFKALGSTVIAADPVHRPELNSVLTYVDHETVYSTADIVTTHTPLLDTTYHLFGEREFAMMKPTAIFINASRGAVVDTPALFNALKSGQIAAAGLDTIEGEAGIFSKDYSDKEQPDPYITEALAMPNVTLSTHIGFDTDVAVQNMVEISLEDTLKVLAGQPCDHIVD